MFSWFYRRIVSEINSGVCPNFPTDIISKNFLGVILVIFYGFIGNSSKNFVQDALENWTWNIMIAQKLLHEIHQEFLQIVWNFLKNIQSFPGTHSVMFYIDFFLGFAKILFRISSSIQSVISPGFSKDGLLWVSGFQDINQGLP